MLPAVELDLESWLFPSEGSIPVSFKRIQFEIEEDQQKIVAKVLALAYLNRHWPAGMAFVTKLVRHINVLDLKNNIWKSWSGSSQSYEVTCTLNVNRLPESVEGLIHEASHLALHRLQMLNSCQTSNARTYRHPWKPDAREAQGALLAAHAFMNVSQWYFQLAMNKQHRGYLVEAQRILSDVGEVMHQLRIGTNLSPWGRLIVATLDIRYEQINEQINKEITCQLI